LAEAERLAVARNELAASTARVTELENAMSVSQTRAILAE
jgi:hypothetical protein